MNSLIGSLGSVHLSFIVSTAELLGLTRLAPASITYYHINTQTGDPDSGYTNSWSQTATITDVLVGHYSNDEIAGSGGTVTRTDIVAMFLQSELNSEPQEGDQILYEGTTYEYIEHRAAAGLYLVGMRKLP